MKANSTLAEAPKYGNFSETAGEFLRDTALTVLSLTHLDRLTLRSELAQIRQDESHQECLSRHLGIREFSNPTLDRLSDTRTLKTKYVQTRLLETYLDGQQGVHYRDLPDDIRRGALAAALSPQLGVMLPERLRQSIGERSELAQIARNKIQEGIVELLGKDSISPTVRQLLIHSLELTPTVRDYLTANSCLCKKNLPLDVRTRLEVEVSKILNLPEAAIENASAESILKYYLSARSPFESHDPSIQASSVEVFKVALQFVKERVPGNVASMEWYDARAAAILLPDPQLLRPELLLSLTKEAARLIAVHATNPRLSSLCDEDRAELGKLCELFLADKEITGIADRILALTAK